MAEWQTRRIQKTLCDEPTGTEELRNKELGDSAEGASMPLEPVAATLDPHLDPIESAIARAIEKAAGAGRFDVVAQLARELEARRLSSAGNVVSLSQRVAKSIP